MKHIYISILIASAIILSSCAANNVKQIGGTIRKDPTHTTPSPKSKYRR